MSNQDEPNIFCIDHKKVMPLSQCTDLHSQCDIVQTEDMKKDLLDMLNAARRLAERGDLDVLHRKISNAPAADAPAAPDHGDTQ